MWTHCSLAKISTGKDLLEAHTKLFLAVKMYCSQRDTRTHRILLIFLCLAFGRRTVASLPFCLGPSGFPSVLDKSEYVL